MNGCMRTTISIDDGLLERARQASLERRCSLGEVIEDSLRAALVDRPKFGLGSVARPLKTFGGSGVLPGVDLCSSSDLAEWMEGR